MAEQVIKIPFKGNEYACWVEALGDDWLRLRITSDKSSKTMVRYVPKEKFFSMFLPDIYKSGKRNIGELNATY